MEGKIIKEFDLFNIGDVPTEEEFEEIRELEGKEKLRNKTKKIRSKHKSIAARKKRQNKPIDVTHPWKRQFFKVVNKPPVPTDGTPILGDKATNYGRTKTNIPG